MPSSTPKSALEQESAYYKAGNWTLAFFLLYVAITVSFMQVQRTPLVMGSVGVYLITYVLEKWKPEHRGTVVACTVVVLAAVALCVAGSTPGS